MNIHFRQKRTSCTLHPAQGSRPPATASATRWTAHDRCRDGRIDFVNGALPLSYAADIPALNAMQRGARQSQRGEQLIEIRQRASADPGAGGRPTL
jgi:hypothetical protein